MKKKRYIMPCLLVQQLAIETHLTAGSFQAKEPGAKQGNDFDEELDFDEAFDEELPRL